MTVSDPDLESLSVKELAEEVRRLREGIRRHRDNSGHDLCWFTPELWQLLPDQRETGVEVPAWPEFMRRCATYRQSLDSASLAQQSLPSVIHNAGEKASAALTWHGGCLCGGVRYKVVGPVRQIIACHCTQCRKTSGNFVAATQCKVEDLEIVGESLSWFASSDAADRGFCNKCGGNLFWRPKDKDVISIMAGTLDESRDLAIAQHLFLDQKQPFTVI